jgi:hypothetical protein
VAGLLRLSSRAKEFHLRALREPCMTLSRGLLPNQPDHAAVRPHDWGNEAARLSVVSALDALGGLHSPGGACAWHVLGCETTIEKWALTSGWANRRITRDMAAGILVSALGILKAHYGL